MSGLHGWLRGSYDINGQSAQTVEESTGGFMGCVTLQGDSAKLSVSEMLHKAKVT